MSLDVNGIVTNLMTIEKNQLNRLNKTKANYDLQLNGYANVKKLLQQFNDNLDKLAPLFKTNTYSSSSSNEQIISTAITGSTVSPGTHQITVSQIAQAHQVASANQFSSKTDPLGVGGNLTVTIGSNALTLAINSQDSLVTIRDNINNSANNIGISASILTSTAIDGSNQYNLVLASTETGLTNAMVFSGDSNVLTALNLTNTLSTPQDALFTFDGFAVDSPTNTVTSVLDGLLLNLNGTLGTANITIASDETNKIEAVKNGIKSMVDSYNVLVDLIDKNASLTSLRDSTYSLVKLNLTLAMQQQLSGFGDISSLLDMGIMTAKSEKFVNSDGIEYVSSGKLTIDNKLLDNALLNDFTTVCQFFTSKNTGFISKFDQLDSSFTAPDGAIFNREQSIKQQESSLEHRIDHEESRLERVRANLIKQYSALDVFIQRYQHISDFLEIQLSALRSTHKN